MADGARGQIARRLAGAGRKRGLVPILRRLATERFVLAMPAKPATPNPAARPDRIGVPAAITRPDTAPEQVAGKWRAPALKE